MDLHNTKGKRGRPKGSKNKSKIIDDKMLIQDNSIGSVEEIPSDEMSVVSQMQSFRNSILEHLKIELFGKGNDTTLSTPPLNLSTLLSTSTNAQSDNSNLIPSSSIVSNKNVNVSCERNDSITVLNKTETTIESQPKKRGRPRLSDALKKNNSKINKPIDFEKSHNLPNDCNEVVQSSSSSSVLEVREKVLPSDQLQTKNNSVNNKPHIVEENMKQIVPSKKDCFESKQISLQELTTLCSTSQHFSATERNQDNICITQLNLVTLEKVLQDLKLSPTKISYHFKDVNDGSILAQIFTKGSMKSLAFKTSAKSKLLNSNKVFSSYTSFCKRRMIKRKSQENDSKIFLESLSDHVVPFQASNSLLEVIRGNHEKENICLTISNNVTNASDRTSFNSKVVSDLSKNPVLKSTGIQCDERRLMISTESQTSARSHRSRGTQTDNETRQTLDVHVQTGLRNQSDKSDILICTKCLGNAEGVEKCNDDSQADVQTPMKSMPILSSSFLNNLNLTNYKLDALLSNPSMLGDVTTNKEVTFNMQSNFFDSAFLNDLLVAGTPKNTHENHSASSQIDKLLPKDITSSTGSKEHLSSISSNGDNSDKNEPSKLRINKVNSVNSSLANLVEKDELLNADDEVIIRGNIPMRSTMHEQDDVMDDPSDAGTLLDEGFINESRAEVLRVEHLSRREPVGGRNVVIQLEAEGRNKKRKRPIDDDDEGDDDDGDGSDDLGEKKKKKKMFELSSWNGRSQANVNQSLDSNKSSSIAIKTEKARLKSPLYKKIRRCMYVDAKPLCKDYEPHSCDCKARPDDPKEICCGESCLNRLVYTECHSSACPTGDKCSNRRIQKKQWVEGLVKFQTKDRGYGVKTHKSFISGQFIIEYCGEVVSENEFKRRMSQNYHNERHHYCLNLDSGMVIDGYRMGNISRFINHSCQPNCVMEKWNVNGVYRMGLFAVKDIESGAELTYDYNFYSYNILSQQICKCGSQNCRGLMAGKNQRLKKNDKIKPPVLKRRSSRKVRPGYLNNASSRTSFMNISTSLPLSTFTSASSKMGFSTKEKVFAQNQRLFLQRNVNKVKKNRMRLISKVDKRRRDVSKSLRADGKHEEIVKDYGKFLTNLPGSKNLFSKKSCLRTSPPIASGTFKAIFKTIIDTLSDVDVNTLNANHPSLKCLILPRIPELKTTVQEPLSLEAIMSNVQLDHYTNFQDFNDDINKLFNDIQRQEAFNADIEDFLLNAKRVYKEASKDVISLYSDIILKPLPPLLPPRADVSPSRCDVKSDLKETFRDLDVTNDSSDSKRVDDDGDIEVIRCVCNIYKDEGLMIQCEKCEKWQHCMCMNVKGDEDHYTCELCDPRPISKEVLLMPQPDDALAHCRYYTTLMRDEHLQVRVGDCVYVTREGSTINMEDFKTNSCLIKEQLDIFRVERLWMKYNGNGCAFGHYYMRPHETFHEPSRKFYPNEVFRAPLYHVVPIEAIMGTCCVMDPITYCKGHPIGMKDDDIYVCEFRVDKAARLFSRINKSQHMINTNTYCFNHYATKLKPKRTYMVHQSSDADGTS